MKYKFALPLLMASLFALPVFAQKGFKIRAKLDNYAEKELVLGFHYGEKQYVKDTVTADAEGWFTFQADTLLPCGVYLLVLKPDNTFIQILISDDQQFSIQTDAKDAVNKMSVKGSDDNAHFYDYLKFLAKMRPDADTLRAQFTRLRQNPADSLRITQALESLDASVKKMQADIAKKYAGSMTAKIVRSAIEPEIPEFKGADERKNQQDRYWWFRSHYFDNIDITDPCMLRGPVLHGKIDTYISKVVPQHPDSINVAIDYLLERMRPSPEVFKYYIIHFLNHFAASKMVGFDACYVHMVKKYYEKGDAPWTKKDDLDKIIDNANRLEPILIGKIAPNIMVKDRNDQPHALYDVDADYTVLFFWDPECGHCKKAAPFMLEFAKKFKDRGVKIFAVCTAVVTADKETQGKKDNRTGQEVIKGECWKSLEEKQFSDEFFMNLYDPYIQSRYKSLYDVRSTPQIFILDRRHEILMKRIGAEQLSEVMEEVMKFQEDKKKSMKK